MNSPTLNRPKGKRNSQRNQFVDRAKVKSDTMNTSGSQLCGADVEQLKRHYVCLYVSISLITAPKYLLHAVGIAWSLSFRASGGSRDRRAESTSHSLFRSP
jgi:hypothetical protein